MQRVVISILLAFATVAVAQESLRDKKNLKDTGLKKGASVAPDQSLAGDITRKREEKTAAPALHYDQFRLGVELQVASKRREQIDSLKKIIGLSSDPKEMPSLLFRLGELYWEESKFYFFEGNRKDDELINAMNRGDQAGQERAKAEKAELIAKSKEYSQMAVEEYSEIVQKYKNYERTDEVLYFLGHNLMEGGEDRKALVAYKRLIEKYKKSRYLPDALLAYGEYYFNSSKGKKDLVEKALEYYKQAASFPDNQVYAFALYKQGWCYFNLANYPKALDMFKAVVLYGEYAGAAALERDAGKSGKATLIREARNDFVRTYARFGSPGDARAEFGKLAKGADDRFLMMKQLANLYYEDGKDKEAALTFNSLIRERPLSPETPGFQGKIVDCVLRAGNKKMTVEQVRRLVKLLEDVEKAKVAKDEKDKKALADARDQAERTLSNLAVNWHTEGKKTRDEDTFGLANEVYSDYLALFSESAKAYDLRFYWAELLNDNLQKYDRAAQEYSKVVLLDGKRIDSKQKPGKWLTNAAYNAVLAYDEVVKRLEESGKLKLEPSKDIHKKVAIAPERKQLLDACERYIKYVPHGPKRVEIEFKAANLYYRHNHFDEAVLRFSEIALRSPEYKFENGERAGEVSAELVLDSYNLVGDWAKVNEWARKFYHEPKLATGPFRGRLSKMIEQSAFKLVNQLEAKKENGKAAEGYLAFVGEFPKSEIADKALYNASIDFFNAKMLDRAIDTRARIIRQYPKSEFVPACIYANAEAREAIGDFEEAARAYETYVSGYERSLSGGERAARKKKGSKKGAKAAPEQEKAALHWEESKAQVALYDAGVLRDGLSEHKLALKARERYLDLWPDSKDAETVFLSIADLYERTGAHSHAIKQLEEYQKKYSSDANKVLTAQGRVAEIYAKKLNKPKDAQHTYEKLLAYYEKQPAKAKKSLDNPSLDAVARAHLLSADKDYQRFAAVRVRWGRLPRPEIEFKQGLRDKSRFLETLQKHYTQTVGFKAGDPAICALHKLGMAYAQFADALINAPPPRGAPPELQEAIREEIGKNAQPVKDKAAEAFMAAVQKSRELDIVNECYSSSLKLLRESYRPAQFPPPLEQFAELKDVKGQSTGGDLLASIQPIPVRPPPARESAPTKDKEMDVKEDSSSDLDAAAREPAPANDEPPAEPPAPPAKPSSKTSPKSKSNEEPEDVLK
jgi:tetratricopeptide (TPR) repeat protein